MGINATFTKTISVTATSQELTAETFAADGMSAMCVIDGFRVAVANTDLLVRFSTTDDWYPWPTTEFLPVRAESLYVKLATGTASIKFLVRIVGIRMTTLNTPT